MSSCVDTTKNIAWLHITWRLDLYTAVSNDHCQGIQSWQLNCLVRSILKFKTLGNAANQQLRQCSEPSMNRTCILRWLHTRQRSACSLKLLSKPSYFHKESANHANQRVSDNWDIFSKFFCTTSRDWSKFAFIPREWGEWQLTGRQVYAVVQASTAPFLLDDGFLPPLERHWVCFQPATEVDRKQNETSWASVSSALSCGTSCLEFLNASNRFDHRVFTMQNAHLACLPRSECLPTNQTRHQLSCGHRNCWIWTPWTMKLMKLRGETVKLLGFVGSPLCQFDISLCAARLRASHRFLGKERNTVVDDHPLAN